MFTKYGPTSFLYIISVNFTVTVSCLGVLRRQRLKRKLLQTAYCLIVKLSSRGPYTVAELGEGPGGGGGGDPPSPLFLGRKIFFWRPDPSLISGSGRPPAHLPPPTLCEGLDLPLLQGKTVHIQNIYFLLPVG